MKRLPFTPRRIAFRVGLWERVGCSCWAAGVIVGHFVHIERAWFDGRPSWVRYYSIRVLSGPSSVRGSLVCVASSDVVRWPYVEHHE